MSRPHRANIALSASSVLFLHAITFLVLLSWSWRKWNDPIVDFGRELYVPWQLTRGKVLYRDIASLFGPLSPYVNALWMRLFGVSLMTIAMCNAAIFAGIIAAVHYFVRIASDRFTATVASLTALILCGFCQYRAVGNYNFITPYSHEATHGFALGVLTLIFMHRAIVTSRVLPGALAGLFFGLSLLTKTEVPVATAAALATGLFGYTSLGRSARRTMLPIVTAFCGGCVVGPALFFAYFRQYEATPMAIRDVAAAWVAVWNPEVTMSLFYRRVSGTDQPVLHLLSMLLLFAGVLAAIAAGIALTSMAPPKGSRASKFRHMCLVAMLAAAPVTQLLPLGRVFPLATLAALAASGRSFWKQRHDRGTALCQLALMMWCAFATAMLAKTVLRTSIYAYGFYLALPAVTVAIISLCTIIPDVLDNWRPGRLGRDFRLFVTLAIGAAVAPHLGLSNRLYVAKNESVGEGGDRFYVSSDRNAPAALQGLRFRDAMTTLGRSLKHDDTFAVVPEGVMLNYLLRVESPLPVITLMPPEVVTFGESANTDSLRASPPTYVVFVHKNTDEYGYPLFGTTLGYGERTMAWVRAQYRPFRTFGNDPLSSGGEGIEIFRIASSESTPTP
jgi:hypothetical protein